MERKIGEIFEYNGEWYQCVKSPDDTCLNCDMNFDGKCPIPIKECVASARSDLSYVIFKKLEKVGEPYVKRVSDGTFSTFQKYRVYNSVILPKEPYIYCNFIDGTIEIEIKQNKEEMEEKKLNLKPFDIQKAREGKSVCTRDGRKARIICFDLKNDEYPIIAAVENDSSETLFSYTTNGEIADGIESDKDLMMLHEKKECWTNVYKKEQNRYVKGIFPSREIALNSISEKSREYIATIKITWEEQP